jgi:transposase
VNGKERAAVWRERVEAWKQSGQSRTAFAAGHGIDRWTLGRWIRRLTSDGSSASAHRDRPRDKPMTQSAPLVMEILDEASRRRRWSEEEKLRLVTETMEPGMSVSLVARRRGVSASQLFRWRRQFAGETGVPEQTPIFAPVQLLSEPLASPPTSEPEFCHGGIIEIMLGGGRVVRVDRHVDAEALRRVLGVLEEGR